MAEKTAAPAGTDPVIRAFQWDLARQVERFDWLLAQLPRYADWGYQRLYLHLEDAVAYPSVPGVARKDAYSHGQIQKLVSEAAKRDIGVVPIVNLLGHTQYLIKMPEFRDLNELRNPDGSGAEQGQLCPADPRTLELAEKLLRDASAFCSAGEIHVGLDESFQLGRHPASRRGIEHLGLAGHFANYAARLHERVHTLGFRMGLWADMLALLPEAIPLLPRGLSAYDWYYYPFGKAPRMELRNFAEYELAPALKAQGIEYWGCPMNGAFRYEPLPVFGDRLANIRSWWARCKQQQAAGMLITSWEAYRLAAEMPMVVDAAAASLWLDAGVDDNVGMLTRGFARVFGHKQAHGWARSALACDERAFSGYARWEINERWDLSSPAEGLGRQLAEQRFFERLTRHELPPPFKASAAFRLYLAQRDVFVRRVTEVVLRLRRLVAKRCGENAAPANWTALPEAVRALDRLGLDLHAFKADLRAGSLAARAMWRRTRAAGQTGQNELILKADAKRLSALTRWFKRLRKRPQTLWQTTPTIGAWQLQFVVHNCHPALQRVLVEERRPDGTWRELRGRYTIEFRALAARPNTPIKRSFGLPLEAEALVGDQPRLRIAIRGLGQVGISHVEAVNGVRSLRPKDWPLREKRLLGKEAPRDGFPLIDMRTNSEEIPLNFGGSAKH